MDPQGKSRPKRVVLKIAVETWMIGPDIFQEENMLHTLVQVPMQRRSCNGSNSFHYLNWMLMRLPSLTGHPCSGM